MEQPKVSVIIPVYNTEKYVREAVESIMNQTLRDIEIIAVNDGSTDGSLAILEELAHRDERVKVYSQANARQAAARNHGLRHATGEFLYYMDSDDWLEPDALEVCYHTCQADRLDFVFFEARVVNDYPDSPFHMDYHHHDIDNRVYRGIDMMRFLIETSQFKIPPYLNFIRKEFSDDFDLQYHPQASPHEDQLHTALLYLNARSTRFIQREFFHRRIRQGSVVTTPFNRAKMKSYLVVATELQKFACENPGEKQEMVERFLVQMLDAAFWQAYTLPWVQRIKLWGLSITRYRSYVSRHTRNVLLFKSSVGQLKQITS